MAKTTAAVGCVGILILLALSFGFSALLGLAAAWALSFFGLHVPWYVCSVIIFILGSIFRAAK